MSSEFSRREEARSEQVVQSPMGRPILVTRVGVSQKSSKISRIHNANRPHVYVCSS